MRNDREHPRKTGEEARLSPDRRALRRLGAGARGRRGRDRPLGAVLLLGRGRRGRLLAGSGELAASGGGRGLMHTRVVRGGSVGRVLSALLQRWVIAIGKNILYYHIHYELFRVSPKSSRQFQSRPKMSDWIREFDATIQKIKKIANCLINGLQYKKINKRIYNKYIYCVYSYVNK